MNPKEKHLLADIYDFGKKQKKLVLTGNLALFFLITLILWISAALADHFFYFSEITRWGLWIIHLGILSYLVIRFVVKPVFSWMKFTQDSDFAPVTTEIGKHYSGMQGSLTNAYHLIIDAQPDNTSEILKKAAIDKYLKRFQDYSFKDQLHFLDYFPALRIFIPVTLASLVLLGFRFGEIKHSTLRLLNPANEYLVIPGFTFTVLPGNGTIVKGDPVQFSVTYNGPELETCQVTLWNPDIENSTQTILLEREDEAYTGFLKDTRESFHYQIEGMPLYEKQYTNHLKSALFEMKVLTPPMYKNLDVTLIPPLYSGLEKQFLDRNIGDINALAGTQVMLKADVTKDIESAILKFGSDDSIPAEIQGKRISGQFRVNQNDTYKIQITDTYSLKNRRPIDYSINVIPDNPPYIELSEPGKDIESPLDASVVLQIEALDDYGISEMRLFYKFIRSSKAASDTNWQSLRLPFSGKIAQKQLLNHIWDFNTLPLAFDDGLMYYAQATDNNSITGPGIGKTNIFYIRFPSLEELFDSFTERENQELDKMEEVADKSKELKEELEKINRELKRADQIDWEQKQQLENMVDKHKELQQKIDDIRKNMEELVEQLADNNLISEDVLEKYMQLQDLFREIAPPELMEAMQKLQQALENPDPNRLKQALQEFKLNQEQFQKNIERTMELLKQVQLEQRMDQLVKMAESLHEQQEKITEDLKQNNPPDQTDLRQLSDRQQQQMNSMKNLERNLDTFLQEPRLERFQESKKSLEQALEQVRNPEMNKQMQSAKQDMAAGNQKDSQQSSEKLTEEYEQLKNTLAKAQEQMLNQSKQNIREKMQAITQKMLKLSHNQEKLAHETAAASSLSDVFKDLSVEQGRTLENFQRMVSDLVQLSKETFFIQPGMSQALGKSQGGMVKSLDELSEHNKSQAARYQTQALSGLNEGILQMLQSLSQLSQSKSGTGFEKFMEQLQKMAGSQGQINDGTLSMVPGGNNPGSYSMQQQAEMRRLAGEQAALRDALQKMSGEMGSRRDVMGRLGELAGQMDEVIQDLIRQNVNPKTIERQRQILSRMLDAQKSINERELSKKRKAEQAKNYRVTDPGALKNLTDLERKKLLDALQRARSEGYQNDYQRLIEAYFKLLLQNQTEKN